jgi:hypothetical protein
VYRDYASLPPELQLRIQTVVEPKDPDTWVQTPIDALGGQTLLEALNADGGEETINRYFAGVEAFEKSLSTKPAEDLGAIFNFDQHDLEENRAGRISDAQRRRLWRIEVWRLIGFVAAIAGGLLVSTALIAGWLRGDLRDSATAGALMLIGVLLAVYSWESWLDIAGGAVQSLEGDLLTTESVTTGRYGSTSYQFEIARQKFTVPKAAWDQVREGRRRVYFLPRTRALLSVEPAG